MDKNKLSFYASYVAIACGILIIALRFFSTGVSNFNLAMGALFLVIGFIGLRSFRNK